MATKLERLETRKTRVEARIAELEEQYPKVLRAKSYTFGFGSASVTRQDFNSIRNEYRDLLDDLESLESEIATLDGSAPNSGSYAAQFRGAQ